MLEHYIMDSDHKIKPASLEEWVRWFELDDKVVKQEYVGPYFISTVFLGLNHRFTGDGPPILFETMVFRDNESDIDMARCCTYKQALKQHAKMVRKWSK